RAETGSVLWSDTLRSGGRTRADAVFSGIDADPIVQDGVVVVASASGPMQASALTNGRPLWQAKLGSHRTPWSAGNALFVLTDNNDLVALFKRSGAVRWSTPLAQHDDRDKTRDTTPPLYGPILAGNALLVVNRRGELMSFKTEDGTPIGSTDLASGLASPPVVVGGALYLVTQDGVLKKYY
ncbi:MAG: PQQ-binding-like beta-propeller repeat protein, partial [Rickettsiales bacterium]